MKHTTKHIATVGMLALAGTASADIVEKWTQIFPGSPSRIRIASNGDVIVGGSKIVGTVFNIPTNVPVYDGWLVRLDPAGNVVWQWQSGWEESDFLEDFAIASNGDIIATFGTATTLITGDPDNIRTLRLNAAGSTVWSHEYTGPAGIESAQPHHLAVDANDNVYVAGEEYGPGSNFIDSVVLRYDANGNLQWIRSRGGDMWDRILDIAVDSQGRLGVAGTETNTPGSLAYMASLMDSSGNTLWTYYKVPPSGPGNADAFDVEFDTNDNLIATGTVDFGASTDDMHTVKISPSGSLLWQHNYNGPGNGWDRGYALAVGPNDEVYATGEAWKAWSWEYFDIQTLGYSSTGQITMQNVFGTVGPAYAEDQSLNIATFPNGNVVRLGCDTDKPGPDYIIHHFAPDGTVLDQIEADIPGGSTSFNWKNLALDPNGKDVYFVGWGNGFLGNPVTWSSVVVKVEVGASSFCETDCDESGSLNVFDYICFGEAFANQDPYADCDGSGGFSIFDYICYGSAYAAGCP